MAQKRMFSLKITDTDAFLDMPLSTQALYFHLCMHADDDGFLGNPKKILRAVGCNDDDLKVLMSKRFVLGFPNGVVVIKHWLIHNLIRNDRYKETTYLKEKKQLTENEFGAYTECHTKCLPNGNQMAPQVRLGKVRLDKYKEKKDTFIKPSISDILAYLQENNIKIDGEKFFNFYESKGWMIGKNKMKDWKACVRTWIKKDDQNVKGWV